MSTTAHQQLGRRYFGRFAAVADAAYRAASRPDGRDGPLFKITPEVEISTIGGHVENTRELLEECNKDVRESAHLISEMTREVAANAALMHEALVTQIRSVRDARMSVVNDMREMLTALRDVRQFFLERDYATEVERLERFVRLCREIQALKTEGVFDAVCDTALRMAP